MLWAALLLALIGLVCSGPGQQEGEQRSSRMGPSGLVVQEVVRPQTDSSPTSSNNVNETLDVVTDNTTQIGGASISNSSGEVPKMSETQQPQSKVVSSPLIGSRIMTSENVPLIQNTPSHVPPPMNPASPDKNVEGPLPTSSNPEVKMVDITLTGQVTKGSDSQKGDYHVQQPRQIKNIELKLVGKVTKNIDQRNNGHHSGSTLQTSNSLVQQPQQTKNIELKLVGKVTKSRDVQRNNSQQSGENPYAQYLEQQQALKLQIEHLQQLLHQQQQYVLQEQYGGQVLQNDEQQFQQPNYSVPQPQREVKNIDLTLTGEVIKNYGQNNIQSKYNVRNQAEVKTLDLTLNGKVTKQASGRNTAQETHGEAQVYPQRQPLLQQSNVKIIDLNITGQRASTALSDLPYNGSQIYSETQPQHHQSEVTAADLTVHRQTAKQVSESDADQISDTGSPLSPQTKQNKESEFNLVGSAATRQTDKELLEKLRNQATFNATQLHSQSQLQQQSEHKEIDLTLSGQGVRQLSGSVEHTSNYSVSHVYPQRGIRQQHVEPKATDSTLSKKLSSELLGRVGNQMTYNGPQVFSRPQPRELQSQFNGINLTLNDQMYEETSFSNQTTYNDSEPYPQQSEPKHSEAETLQLTFSHPETKEQSGVVKSQNTNNVTQLYSETQIQQSKPEIKTLDSTVSGLMEKEMSVSATNQMQNSSPQLYSSKHPEQQQSKSKDLESSLDGEESKESSESAMDGVSYNGPQTVLQKQQTKINTVDLSMSTQGAKEITETVKNEDTHGAIQLHVSTEPHQKQSEFNKVDFMSSEQVDNKGSRMFEQVLPSSGPQLYSETMPQQESDYKATALSVSSQGDEQASGIVKNQIIKAHTQPAPYAPQQDQETELEVMDSTLSDGAIKPLWVVVSEQLQSGGSSKQIAELKDLPFRLSEPNSRESEENDKVLVPSAGTEEGYSISQQQQQSNIPDLSLNGQMNKNTMWKFNEEIRNNTQQKHDLKTPEEPQSAVATPEMDMSEQWNKQAESLKKLEIQDENEQTYSLNNPTQQSKLRHVDSTLNLEQSKIFPGMMEQQTVNGDASMTYDVPFSQDEHLAQQLNAKSIDTGQMIQNMPGYVNHDTDNDLQAKLSLNGSKQSLSEKKDKQFSLKQQMPGKLRESFAPHATNDNARKRYKTLSSHQYSNVKPLAIDINKKRDSQVPTSLMDAKDLAQMTNDGDIQTYSVQSQQPNIQNSDLGTRRKVDLMWANLGLSEQTIQQVLAALESGVRKVAGKHNYHLSSSQQYLPAAGIDLTSSTKQRQQLVMGREGKFETEAQNHISHEQTHTVDRQKQKLRPHRITGTWVVHGKRRVPGRRRWPKRRLPTRLKSFSLLTLPAQRPRSAVAQYLQSLVPQASSVSLMPSSTSGARSEIVDTGSRPDDLIMEPDTFYENGKGEIAGYKDSAPPSRCILYASELREPQVQMKLLNLFMGGQVKRLNGQLRSVNV